MKRFTKEREQEIIKSVPKGAALLGYPIEDIDIYKEYGMTGNFATKYDGFEMYGWETCAGVAESNELWICRQEDYETLAPHFDRPWENEVQTPETHCCFKDKLTALQATYEATRQDLWLTQDKLKQVEAELDKLKPVEPAVGQIWLGTKSNAEYRLISFETPEGETMYNAVCDQGICYSNTAWSKLQETTQRCLKYLRES